MSELDDRHNSFLVSRRTLLIASAPILAAAIFAGCQNKQSKGLQEQDSTVPDSTATSQAQVDASTEISTPVQPFNSTLIGQSLLAMKDEQENGWRFKSAIQSPHYQTDRDVGASGIGMGFLMLHEGHKDDPTWLHASEKTASWLLSVAQKDSKGNLYWPDYSDDQDISESAYTSFDDGAIGVGDYLWRLYEKTGNEEYRQASESSLAWLFEQAENVGTEEIPSYRWRYDTSDDDSSYETGMGMGSVGIIHTLAEYYDRMRERNPVLASQCRLYIEGGLRHIENAREALGGNDGDARALPETSVIGLDGDTAMNSGYLSGSAGLAFMYLRLYKTFGDEAYLQKADDVFSWLEDRESGPLVVIDENTIAWKLMMDPQGGDNAQLATGFEEGAAGIGWVYLQAYKVSGNNHYLDMARKAGNWLSSIAQPMDAGGVAWYEDESPRKEIIHANLNNGAAGIGFFLHALGEVSGDQKYITVANQAKAWLEATAIKRPDGRLVWKDNDGEDDYVADPSWHWGTAGIVAFILKTEGANVRMPGHQDAL